MWGRWVQTGSGLPPPTGSTRGKRGSRQGSFPGRADPGDSGFRTESAGSLSVLPLSQHGMFRPIQVFSGFTGNFPGEFTQRIFPGKFSGSRIFFLIFQARRSSRTGSGKKEIQLNIFLTDERSEILYPEPVFCCAAGERDNYGRIPSQRSGTG